MHRDRKVVRRVYVHVLTEKPVQKYRRGRLVHIHVSCVVKIAASVLRIFVSRHKDFEYGYVRNHGFILEFTARDEESGNFEPILKRKVKTPTALFRAFRALFPKIITDFQRVKEPAFNKVAERLTRKSFDYLRKKIGIHAVVMEALAMLKLVVRGEKILGPSVACHRSDL